MKTLIPYFFCIFLIIYIFFICVLSNNYAIEFDKNTIKNSYININNEYIWPVLGYNKITSNFGKRNAPTKGASTFHSGIDIGAPVGSNLYSIINGKIIYIGFSGAGGYTIKIKNDNIEVIYCHVHDNYLPNINSLVKKGQVIGKVGPKNVYSVLNNPYKDSNGNPTNGATTGPHLHLGIKVNNEFINPLTLLSIN